MDQKKKTKKRTTTDRVNEYFEQNSPSSPYQWKLHYIRDIDLVSFAHPPPPPPQPLILLITTLAPYLQLTYALQ